VWNLLYVSLWAPRIFCDSQISGKFVYPCTTAPYLVDGHERVFQKQQNKILFYYYLFLKVCSALKLALHSNHFSIILLTEQFNITSI